jgi:site-specific recombinase XerD
LNCGLRISELVGLNLNDMQEDALRVLGKGNKVRIIYLNDACQSALRQYLAVRRPIRGKDANALFLSSQNERISRSTVHAMVKKRLGEAGIDASQYSSHKLRHTAATLMYQSGKVDIRVLKDILGHEQLSTTQIYTHVNNEQMMNAMHENPLSNLLSTKADKKTED